MKERIILLALVGFFAVFYFVPHEAWAGIPLVSPGLVLLGEYAREHVLTCLVPAFFIAGAIAVYLNKDAVLKYLGPAARRYVSYPIASLSGGVLAVCSCTVLPLFAGIYKRGAGLGPAIAFVFTGPAINITAIFLTVSVLGWQYAAYRLVAAMVIAIVSGLVMSAAFDREETRQTASRETRSATDRRSSSETRASGSKKRAWTVPQSAEPAYSGGSLGLFLGSQVGLLILLSIGSVPLLLKIVLAALAIGAVLKVTFSTFHPDDRRQWMEETWTFTKQIMPYLFVGVFLAGLIAALLPADFVGRLVGGNGALPNAVAAVSGALMYFATLTEIPILQSLIALGMGSGPAMALLLTGNALSLPNLIVLHKILGPAKTALYLALTVGMSIAAGMAFGALVP